MVGAEGFTKKPTLRQEIEKIGCNLICKGANYKAKSSCQKIGLCTDCKDTVDRICAAISKTAEGMPEKIKDVHLTCEYCTDYAQGVAEELTECQAYWQEELK